jgi:hypothetical protein
MIWLIGRRCKAGNILSRPVLIDRGLNLYNYSLCSFEGTIPEKFPVGYSEGDTPVTIPNTEVKPFSADGT